MGSTYINAICEAWTTHLGQFNESISDVLHLKGIMCAELLLWLLVCALRAFERCCPDDLIHGLTEHQLFVHRSVDPVDLDALTRPKSKC